MNNTTAGAPTTRPRYQTRLPTVSHAMLPKASLARTNSLQHTRPRRTTAWFEFGCQLSYDHTSTRGHLALISFPKRKRTQEGRANADYIGSRSTTVENDSSTIRPAPNQMVLSSCPMIKTNKLPDAVRYPTCSCQNGGLLDGGKSTRLPRNTSISKMFHAAINEHHTFRPQPVPALHASTRRKHTIQGYFTI